MFCGYNILLVWIYASEFGYELTPSTQLSNPARIFVHSRQITQCILVIDFGISGIVSLASPSHRVYMNARTFNKRFEGNLSHITIESASPLVSALVERLAHLDDILIVRFSQSLSTAGSLDSGWSTARSLAKGHIYPICPKLGQRRLVPPFTLIISLHLFVFSSTSWWRYLIVSQV